MPNEFADSTDNGKDLEQDSKGENPMLSDVLSNETDFRQAILSPNRNNEPSNALDAFDKPGQGLELTDEPNQSENTVLDENGRTIRKRSSKGNDTVIAYDQDVKAHNFEDTKITEFPVDFSKIPDWRREQLKEKAGPLIDKYTKGTKPNGASDGQISFNDVASMMKDVAKMDGLTEIEKARLWSDVQTKLKKDDVPMLDADEKPEMIDSWKGDDDPWHAIITMNDGYHANRLINMNEEDATQAILDHENGAEVSKMAFPRSLLWRGAKFVYGVNQGDINASEGTLKSLREYRRKGTFSAYASEWENQFVRPDIDRYGNSGS